MAANNLLDRSEIALGYGLGHGVLLLRASIYTQLTHAYTQNSSLYATILASKTHMLGGRAPPGLPTVRSTPSHYTIYSNGCRLCRKYSPPSTPRLTSRARSPHPYSAAVSFACGLRRCPTTPALRRSPRSTLRSSTRRPPRTCT